MKKLWILALIFFVQCGNSNDSTTQEVFTRDASSDTATILQQYWIIADADEPLGSDVIEKEGERDYMPGIVFMNNGELIENPAGRMSGGEFTRDGDSIHFNYGNGREGSYIIKRMTTDSLQLVRTTGIQTTTLLYYATNTWWPDIDTNPFTKANMSWMIKPQTEETDAQIKQRVEDYIRFCQFYIQGYARTGSVRISFVGFPNIFNYYLSGLTIPNNDRVLNKKWTDCFYNQAQVEKAYTMVRHLVLLKYNWDEKQTNWINQMGPVLEDMRDSLAAE